MDLNDARPIEIDDKQFFDNYFSKFPPEISEFTFTNLFIWKDYYMFLFKEVEDHLLVFSRAFFKNWNKSIVHNKDGIFFLPPVGSNPAEVMYKIFNSIPGCEFHRVPNDVLTHFKANQKYSDQSYLIFNDRDNWDYIYSKEDLINLPGNKFRQKRRWLKKFLEQYDFEFHVITDELTEAAKKLQLEWCDANECTGNESLEEEQKAILNAFDNYNKLNMYGAMISVERKCVSYSLGEKLNESTLVIHFEKAHINYEGSYQSINNLFLKEFANDVSLINREQDLGISGLRKAKEAYKPVRMIEKSVIYHT